MKATAEQGDRTGLESGELRVGGGSSGTVDVRRFAFACGLFSVIHMWTLFLIHRQFIYGFRNLI
jgi:hypothetical protein